MTGTSISDLCLHIVSDRGLLCSSSLKQVPVILCSFIYYYSLSSYTIMYWYIHSEKCIIRWFLSLCKYYRIYLHKPTWCRLYTSSLYGLSIYHLHKMVWWLHWWLWCHWVIGILSSTVVCVVHQWLKCYVMHVHIFIWFISPTHIRPLISSRRTEAVSA